MKSACASLVSKCSAEGGTLRSPFVSAVSHWQQPLIPLRRTRVRAPA